jgi:hypothetical protein
MGKQESPDKSGLKRAEVNFFSQRRRAVAGFRGEVDSLPKISSACPAVFGGHFPSDCNFNNSSFFLILIIVRHLGYLLQPRKGPLRLFLMTSSPSLHL